jgi:hypothetical protein
MLNQDLESMSFRRSSPPVASFLADVGALAAVWTFCGFFFAGVAGVWAGLKGEEIGSWVTTGGVVGFIIGIPVTVAAGLWLL